MKKKIGRPKKKNVASSARNVWDIGKGLGVSTAGDDRYFVKILESLELRDRRAVGRGVDE
ncbi:hypothetical protein SESBI_50053 [Sesbania bispinosa]|nr:hypothetical protein SESBI_50053 [Sesbania bispinosa]